jgi:hypothetical protein
MSVIAIGSVHGAPGATTLALDLARLRPADCLVIEADPDGGSLAARLDLAMRPGLIELAGAARTGIAADDLWRFAQPASGGIAVIVAHPAAEQVQAALRAAVHHVGTALQTLGGHVLIDMGRLRPGSPALGFAALADTTIVMATNSVESVVGIHHRRQLLAGLGDVRLVLDHDSPYTTAEIERTTGHAVWGSAPRATGRRSGARRHRKLVQLLADLAPVADGAPARTLGDPAAESALMHIDAVTA